MKCPFCNKELNIGEDKEYETLLDHVLNPNQESFPLRPTYFCTCEKSFDCFWNETGEFYMGRRSVWCGKPIPVNYDAILGENEQSNG